MDFLAASNSATWENNNKLYSHHVLENNQLTHYLLHAMKMIHLTYDFCRNSLKLAWLQQGKPKHRTTMESMELRDVPFPDLCTAPSSSFHPIEEALLLQITYSYVFIWGDMPVFSGLRSGELKAPCFQGTGKRQSPRCAGCRGYSSSVNPTSFQESKNFRDLWIIEEKKRKMTLI